ncbi:MAG: CHASE2 domain-containing protein [Burkholderiales bacterium]|nr:CHASE2 domain-containing protein [Burkholderiales bacterium]
MKAKWGGYTTMKSDTWVSLLLLAVVAVFLGGTNVLTSLDNRLFDQASKHTGRLPSDQIVIIAIDDQSIANIGRWPWSRDVHAKAIERLSEARVIASTVFFSEPQTDRSLKYLLDIEKVLSQARADDPLTLTLSGIVSGGMKALDTDGALATSIQQSKKVVLPLVFEMGNDLGKADAELPEFVMKGVIPAVPGSEFLPSTRAQLPLLSLGNAAAAVGFLNQMPDPADGVIRSDPLLVNYDGFWVPSLSLVAATKALNLSTADLKQQRAGLFQVGRLKVPVDETGMVWPQFYPEKDGRPTFATDSFFDVYSGKIPPSRYAGKIVVIGATAAGVGTSFVTPLSPVTHPATLLAHTTSSLLSGHFFENPEWGLGTTLAAVLVVVLFVLIVLPRLSAAWAAATTALLLAALLGSEFVLIATQHIWVQLALPAAMLTFAYLGLTTKRFLFTEAGKIKSDQESAETNRMMGLALQGQGQLDMAFDRFRRVPLNDALMDNLANLALDFERKRQFNKAQAVYEHMAVHNPNYKDLRARLKRIKHLSETLILGGSGGHKGGTLVLDGDAVEKPMLGRYQVEKELGKGAMGVVYLGKDPRIGRIVAIKTMALAQEFEGEELDDARQRFFREAETAGRLQHQHIVTIFDAGEDHELAYIAMEFLKGKDLVGYTQVGKLLPVDKVISIAVRVAEALDYAHGLNVVHRDIKPANIMYEPEADVVKVTDFGIARVTDASRTRTGMVLGTPSFMSPEQIAGKKVDGRSDLYSLGVMLFQLLSGALPYRAESMAELMFKIANEPAPDVRTANPQVPEAVARVVARALTKNLLERYASGAQMAHDLQALLRGDVADASVDTRATSAPSRAVAAQSAEFEKTVALSMPDPSQPPATPIHRPQRGHNEL